MPIKQSGLITYKRGKNKIEIEGEATQVKWLIWIDLVGYWLCRIIPLLYLLWITPRLAIALTIFKWLKSR